MSDDEANSARAERELVGTLRRGDPAAYTALRDRYLDRVFSYVRRRVLAHEDAEDITCEVFVAAIRSLARYRGDAGLFVWLVGIARRKLADHYRRAGRRENLAAAQAPEAIQARDSRALGSDADAWLVRRETAAAVRQAMRHLPESQREALLLRYVEALSLREIGAVLGRSDNSVKALLRRGRAALAARLGPELLPSAEGDRSSNDDTTHALVRRAVGDAAPEPGHSIES